MSITASAIALLVAAPATFIEPTRPLIQETDLKLRELFGRKSWFGKTPVQFQWSHDDRYVAYRWNGYDDKGLDLWLYDTREKKARRITDINMMARFDRDTLRAIDRYKKDLQEEKRREKLSEDEIRDLEFKEKRANEALKEPLPAYSGIQDFAWANKSNEMLFVFRGDIYRWKVGAEAPQRLTKTLETEANVEYTRDDAGYMFQRGNGVFRVKWDSSSVEQLNPALPNGLGLGGYSVSPDGSHMAIWTTRIAGPMRQVDYVTFRGRFAQAAKASRVVADDKNPWESYVFVYNINDDPVTNPTGDGKPWEVFKSKVGDDYVDDSFAEDPWSPDSKRLVFSLVSFKDQDLKIMVADVAKKSVRPVYKTVFEGDFTTPGMINPFFTPDGSKIVALLNNSGFEHAWLIDPRTEGATQITRGDFVVYPIGVTPDSKTLYVRASKEHLARTDVYKVDIETGQMTRVTSKPGSYGTPELDHKFQKMAVVFGSWASPNEGYVVETTPGREERQLTQSHRAGFDAVHKIKGELFTYPNRHGQQIQAFMFLPPGYKKTDKRPLFIGVYGGPLENQRAVVDGRFYSSYYLFNMYLAHTLGYVTISIDPRGMSNNGTAFARANMEAPGKAQTEDLVDAVEYMKANYNVDSDRVGVSGWSFGGFQTLHSLLTQPDVFKLGIAGAPVTEWVNYNFWYNYGVIGKAITDKPEDTTFSLIPLAKNLKSPLLLMHGMEDTNVLYQDTVKIYRNFLQYGKGPLVELALDPTGDHGLGGDINGHDTRAIQLAFLMKHWGPYKG